MELREVEGRDHMFVSILLQTAFERPQEARLVEALRAGDDLALELVAEQDGQLMGHIAFARLTAPEGWWALSPVCVMQSRQGRGLGGEIIRYGLDMCRQRHARAVVVVGGSSYYSRFGFSLKAAENLTTPYAREYTLLYPIAPGTAGASERLIYPAPFAGL
ncbi:MAG: N-acetyltransferase [Defluviimonas sp.]|nr:N-acetyltransferase [Defluviimonas sp.]